MKCIKPRGFFCFVHFFNFFFICFVSCSLVLCLIFTLCCYYLLLALRCCYLIFSLCCCLFFALCHSSPCVVFVHSSCYCYSLLALRLFRIVLCLALLLFVAHVVSIHSLPCIVVAHLVLLLFHTKYSLHPPLCCCYLLLTMCCRCLLVEVLYSPPTMCRF